MMIRDQGLQILLAGAMTAISLYETAIAQEGLQPQDWPESFPPIGICYAPEIDANNPDSISDFEYFAWDMTNGPFGVVKWWGLDSEKAMAAMPRGYNGEGSWKVNLLLMAEDNQFIGDELVVFSPLYGASPSAIHIRREVISGLPLIASAMFTSGLNCRYGQSGTRSPE